MLNKNKITGTVILYNPEDDLYENIQSYISDIDVLYMVDNSTVHNKKLIKKLQNSFTNIVYINNNANLGIATALNIGCDKAIEDGAKWILTMDQDSKFINFEHYIKCLESLYNTSDIAILSANTTWDDKKEVPSNLSCEYKETFSAITSANLLNLELFEKVGRFEDKLFIDLVDYDYCIKAQSKNLKVLYFKDVLVKHALGSVFLRKNLITRKIRTKVEHNPQRVYYFARNFLYVAKKYGKQFPKEMGMLKTLNMLYIHEVTKIILYEDKKLKKLYAKLLGAFHFLICKYGKYDI